MKEKVLGITRIVNDNIKEAVFNTLELINAKSLFDKPNLKVLLKPNILGAKEPERAVTTHPEVIRAVIQWVKQFSPRKIIVAESSGTHKRGATDEAFKESKIQEICESEKVEWVSFEKTQRKTYAIKNPLVLNEVVASDLIEDIDICINLPKIKTHGQCILTCCIKNMFGTLILGNKAQMHAKFPTKQRFGAALADIYSVLNPQLTIIDGFLCQEGQGPSAGDIVKLDLIIAGFDPVALDTAVCKIIDFNPKEIPYIMKAEQKGLGSTNLSEFKILGESINSVKRKFKKPKTHMISLPLPRFMAEYVGNVLFKSTIRFNLNKCTLCGTCWKNCPVGAITPPKVLNQSQFIPIWNKKICISCYCCAELCPQEAVDSKMNFIKNVFTSWLGLAFLGVVVLFIFVIFWIFSLFIQ